MSHLIQNSDLCIYAHLPHDIHAFSFKFASQAAVDHWFDLLRTTAFDTHGAPFRLILDWSQSGLLPLTYTFQIGRKFLLRHLTWATTRIAILYGDDFPLILAQTFFRMIRLNGNLTVAFFSLGEYELAVHWLRYEAEEI